MSRTALLKTRKSKQALAKQAASELPPARADGTRMIVPSVTEDVHATTASPRPLAYGGGWTGRESLSKWNTGPIGLSALNMVCLWLMSLGHIPAADSQKTSTSLLDGLQCICPRVLLPSYSSAIGKTTLEEGQG